LLAARQYTPAVAFKILGSISNQETIATGSGIREHARLKKLYGGTRWRKKKGIATLQFEDGRTRTVELHWYEAHGVGRRMLKIKRFI
jgi:hypothetical protein